jgi:hypothetical protein
MTEQTKAILATVTIIACLTLIGVMAYLHVEGAGIAAVSVVGVIIAWLTRTPDRKDPPAGAAVIPLIAVGALLASLFACERPPLSEPPVTVTVEQKEAAAATKYGRQLLECVDKHATRRDIDDCADGVRARWASKDGGTR